MPLVASAKWLALSCVTLFAAHAAAASSAASLLAASEQLPNGEYYIENVATGHQLSGDRNNLYPVPGKGTPITIAGHIGDGPGRHTVVGKGSAGDRKCLSAQWSYGESADGVGAMYDCVLGSLANKGHGGLRPAKQAFIIVSASGHSKRDGGLEERSLFDNVANDGLDDPIEDEEQTIALDVHAFEKRGRRHRKDSHHKASHHKASHKKASHKKAASKSAAHAHHSSSSKATASTGKEYYLIATDHIDNQPPRALSNQIVNSLGQKVLRLSKLQEGNTAQMWRFIRA